MNIELSINATIAKITLRVKQKDDVVRRVCSVAFEREFDSTIAAALGEDARQALESLHTHGITEVKIPLDDIQARCLLTSGQGQDAAKVEILHMRGLKAVGTVKSGDAAPPMIRLHFEFDFAEAPWVFVGRHCASWVDAQITALQAELPLTASAEPPKPNGKGKRKAKKVEEEDEGHDDGNRYVPGPGEAF